VAGKIDFTKTPFARCSKNGTEQKKNLTKLSDEKQSFFFAPTVPRGVFYSAIIVITWVVKDQILFMIQCRINLLSADLGLGMYRNKEER